MCGFDVTGAEEARRYSLSSVKWRRGAGRGGAGFFCESPSLRLSPRSCLAGRESGSVALDDNGANGRSKGDAASSRSTSVKPPAVLEVAD